MKSLILSCGILAIIASALFACFDVQFLNTPYAVVDPVTAAVKHAGLAEDARAAMSHGVGMTMFRCCTEWHARQWPLRFAIYGTLWGVVLLAIVGLRRLGALEQA